MIFAEPNHLRLLSESVHVFSFLKLWGQREPGLPWADSFGLAFFSNHVQRTWFPCSAMKMAPVRAFQQNHKVPIFVGEFGCARFAPGVVHWFRDQLDLYEQYGWSWAYWAFREWDVMNIEHTADAEDKVNHPDTSLFRLFKSYFGKDKQFLEAK